MNIGSFAKTLEHPLRLLLVCFTAFTASILQVGADLASKCRRGDFRSIW